MQVSRPARNRVLSRLCAAALVAGSLPGLASAQTGPQTEEGGTRLTFGFDQGVEWRDNPSLATPAAGSETNLRTGLRFGFVTETRTQRLALDAQAAVLLGDATDTGLINPQARLSYRRESAASVLDLDAFLREANVDTLDFLNSTDAFGNPTLTRAVGSGTRRQTGANARLELGRDAPFGGTLSLGLTDTDYTGTTDPSLIDSRLSTARLSLRFDLSAVTTATLGLSGSRLKEVGTAAESSESLSLGLTHVQTNGSYSATLTRASLPDGSRTSFSLGRSLDLPAGQLTARLGVTRPAAGKTQATGALDWRQELPNATFQLGLVRDVVGNDRADETRLTRVSASYAQELTPTLGLNLSLGLQNSRETLTGLSATTTDITAGLRQALTPDWGLNLGANHRIKDEDGLGTARSSSVFLTLSRDFEFRF